MAPPRFFHPEPLQCGMTLALTANAARHVQVLRLQPGVPVTLFDGRGGEYAAVIERIGRSDVQVVVGAPDPVEREAARAVHLAVGMPANERMDWLVEKATELGAASIQPLVTERSVLRLAGERAAKKRDHWQAIAVAACEQCGRNRVPAVFTPQTLADWLPGTAATDAARSRPAARGLLLALRADAVSLRGLAASADEHPDAPWLLLSGPEGGLSGAEEDAALACGRVRHAVTLGSRVLRAETAALAALAALVV